ncbi:unnamed protein product [Mortierella alpina]
MRGEDRLDEQGWSVGCKQHRVAHDSSRPSHYAKYCPKAQDRVLPSSLSEWPARVSVHAWEDTSDPEMGK